MLGMAGVAAAVAQGGEGEGLPDGFEGVTFDLAPPPESGQEQVITQSSRVTGSTVFGVDERIRVEDTTASPWRSVVHLAAFDRFSNLLGYCSGSMVDDYTVLTAAHCVWDDLFEEPVDSVLVIPGANGLDWPFGTGYGTSFSLPVGWTETRDIMYDFALVHLALTDFGASTRPYMTIASVPDSYFYDPNSVITSAGFPGDKPPGTMWFSAGFSVFVEPYAILTQMDAAPGQSGSPIYLFNDQQGYLFTVGVYSKESGLSNFAVRLSPVHIDALHQYCAPARCSLDTIVIPTGSGVSTATPTSTPTPTATPSPTPTATVAPATSTPTGSSIRSLSEGFNLIGGPITSSLPPTEFLKCLPKSSWSALYIWNSSSQEWEHYFNTEFGVPAYVNDPAVRGVAMVPRGSGVMIFSRVDQPDAFFPETVGVECP